MGRRELRRGSLDREILNVVVTGKASLGGLYAE